MPFYVHVENITGHKLERRTYREFLFNTQDKFIYTIFRTIQNQI